MIKSRKIIVITGKTGFGKSFLANKIRSRFDRVLTLDPKREYAGLIFEDFSVLADYALEYDLPNQSQFNIVFRPSDDVAVLNFVKLGRVLENCLIVVEESAMWDIDDELTKIAKFDRHHRVSLMLISQRVVDLDIAIRSMSTSIIAFNADEPSDVERLSRYGLNVEDLQSLKVGEYIYKGENPRELTED